MKIPSLNKAVAQILATDDRRRASGGGTKLKFFSDPVVEELAKRERASAREPQTLEKAILKTLNGPGEVERLAFESDPSVSNKYHSLYKAKTRLIPDKILKRIAIQDDLVASIVQARCNHLSAFARPRPDRFSTGYVIEALQSTTEAIESIEDPKERQAKKEELQRRITRASNLLLTCGEESLDLGGNQDVLTFPQYVWMSVRNAITVGRIATEILYRQDSSGEKKFAAFRVIDAGTIYKCEGQRDAAESVRRQAKKLLSQLKNDRLVPERYENDEYAWVQVIEDRPVQAFTADECLVHNFYPVPDYELDGYPVTPLDTVISAVTTHLNITSHNKLYFQSGRAARGMLVFRSDDVDEEIVARVRQQFNAQINSTTNAWRMPVFGIGSEDEISWQPIDNSSRDMEFQYLMDMNARVIMSAFAISPEEMPGWSYLSRGTNNQSLCLSKSSKILTNDGLFTIEKILENSDYEYIRVWTGTDWADAKVFNTGDRRVALTTLWNGSVLSTSPDHRFRAIGPEGVPVWKHQKDLSVGDYVLVNRLPAPGIGEIPSYCGKQLTEEMMEVLGWMTGDGNFSLRYNKSTGNIKQGVLSWFYHHEKEEAIWEKHFEILAAFGLTPKHQNRQVSQEEVAQLKETYGFKSVATNRLRNTLYDTAFCQWLLSLGFTDSSTGKNIPSFVHALPVGHRQAFLRGLFSADGTRSETDAVRIVIHSDALRAQVRDILLGLGIRTQFSEGKRKNSIDGREREMVAAPSTLAIKDKSAFYTQIGFLQAHKQPSGSLDDSQERWDRIPASVATGLVGPLVKLGRIKNQNVWRTFKDGCTRKFLVSLLHEAGMELPSWLDEFHLEEVVGVELTDDFENMADVEVFDNIHAFVANGVVVHNSEGNNEYKLEAARDVGIRPLLSHLEDFLNQALLPKIDPYLAKLATIKLVGLDAETAEKESVRISQDMAVHMTQDEILEKVEKKAIGRSLGGEFPLSPAFQAILDKYVPVGVILEEFFDRKGASKDPQWQYVRDSYWFNWQQMLQQQQQMQMQQQQMAAQQQAAAQGSPPPQDGESSGGGQDAGGSPRSAGEAFPQGEGAKPDREENSTERQKTAAADEASASPTDLTRSIDQALLAVDLLSKSEKRLPPSKRALLNKQKGLIEEFMSRFKEDATRAQNEIIQVVSTIRKPSKA